SQCISTICGKWKVPVLTHGAWSPSASIEDMVQVQPNRWTNPWIGGGGFHANIGGHEMYATWIRDELLTLNWDDYVWQ
ncbi:MAG: hypothetical protein LBC62_08905, partial [Treponema sp.]|nr:hypothetical protein [Treponema sp.]